MPLYPPAAPALRTKAPAARHIFALCAALPRGILRPTERRSPGGPGALRVATHWGRGFVAANNEHAGRTVRGAARADDRRHTTRRNVVVMRRALIAGLATCAVAAALAVVALPGLRSRGLSYVTRGAAVHTVESRLAQYGPVARARWAPRFAAAGVGYPPTDVVLVGLKDESRLQVYAGDAPDAPRFIAEFPVLGASGRLGPKLREGDLQVPEGRYGIESLNPNSRFHLSLRVNYPNEFDRATGAADGRTRLGGDIMIHGGTASVGCLAMGDEVAEDLFVLAADVGVERVRVLLCPVDFRVRAMPQAGGPAPVWVAGLYDELRAALAALLPAASR